MMHAKDYDVLQRAVEEGIAYGWRRAWKHAEQQPEEAIAEEVRNQLHEAVISSISDWFHFDDEYRD